MRSLRRRGGTRKQPGSHSKEFKERCTVERRGEARTGGGRGPQGLSRADLTPGEGAARWPLRGPAESRLLLQHRQPTEMGSPPIGRNKLKRWQAEALAGERVRLPGEAVAE